MMATFLRNSKYSENIIYFGPMGCRTGFYLLTRGLDNDTVLELVKECLEKTVTHDGGVFGASAEECGNYKDLDIEDAKRECKRYLDILNSKENNFEYEV
ncbi:MAG: S-ribosylhomocysteine lyase, partial [Clostridiales bacterium]|nr:S-ribosylhomocysteine lyase [Clostridiales bacterium]